MHLKIKKIYTKKMTKEVETPKVSKDRFSISMLVVLILTVLLVQFSFQMLIS